MDRFLVLKEGNCVTEIVPRVRGRDHLRQPSFRGAGEAIIKLFPVKSINFDGLHRFEADELVGIDAGSGSEPFQEASFYIELGQVRPFSSIARPGQGGCREALDLIEWTFAFGDLLLQGDEELWVSSSYLLGESGVNLFFFHFGFYLYQGYRSPGDFLFQSRGSFRCLGRVVSLAGVSVEILMFRRGPSRSLV